MNATHTLLISQDMEDKTVFYQKKMSILSFEFHKGRPNANPHFFYTEKSKKHRYFQIVKDTEGIKGSEKNLKKVSNLVFRISCGTSRYEFLL